MFIPESRVEESKKFSITAKTAQTVELMVSNVAYKATVCKTGILVLGRINPKHSYHITFNQYEWNTSDGMQQFLLHLM